MSFKLEKLPYSFDALEPYIDEKTVRTHYSKHHQGYVDGLNKVLEDNLKFMEKSVEKLLQNISQVPEKIRQKVINTAGGQANHNLYWQIMTPGGSKEPTGKLKEKLQSEFSDYQKFKKDFTEKSASLFGSGWVFLILKKDGSLELKRHSFQNSPFLQRNYPIIGIDLWEHAYYLKYQNKRTEYIKAWWKLLNWEVAENNYQQALEFFK